MAITRGDAADAGAVCGTEFHEAFVGWVREMMEEAEENQCPSCRAHYFELRHVVCAKCMRDTFDLFTHSSEYESVCAARVQQVGGGGFGEKDAPREEHSTGCHSTMTYTELLLGTVCGMIVAWFIVRLVQLQQPPSASLFAWVLR